MSALETGLWLAQYLDPQLLNEFKNYKDDFLATLNGVPDAAIDKDGIKFNKLINNVGFHVNKTTAFTPVVNDFQKGLVPWDKMDTDLLTLTDAEARAMAFNREDEYRKAQTASFRLGLRNYVMQKLAAYENTANTPVLVTTGATVNGRKRLTMNDLIDFLTKVKNLNLDDEGQWFMNLCSEHSADLIADRAGTSNNRDLVINPTTGKIERFYQLKFFENNYNVKYDAALKLKAQNAVSATGDANASIFWYAPNTVYHIEAVQSLYKPMVTDTRNANPTAEFRLHTYGLADKKQDIGFGGIVSAVV